MGINAPLIFFKGKIELRDHLVFYNVMRSYKGKACIYQL